MAIFSISLIDYSTRSSPINYPRPFTYPSLEDLNLKLSKFVSNFPKFLFINKY